MAIFIVLLSVSFVSAVDTTDAVIADGDDDDASVENTTDDDADDSDDDADDADDDEDEDEDDDDEVDEEDLDIGSPYRNGELTPSEAAALADSPDNANGAVNAAGSSNNAKTTGANTNATGNPLLVLLAAVAALGIYPISRRK